ncbi:MAG TPA: AbrB/MazE/SpoVT family DNA-binding domain-containing protein [Nitrospiraceae bacterium]|nr:AbrB/MazE/SpoVT family DNA-binding domain-containing protein [Nitrospiraceae bacterium]
MPTATVTSKGQTTIPKEIRAHLHLQAGDRLEFVIDDTGRVVVMPVTIDIAELEGILPAPRRPVSIDHMNKAITMVSR